MPMRGLPDELVKEIMYMLRDEIMACIGGEWIDTLISDPNINEPLEYLGESIKRMAQADMVIFVDLELRSFSFHWSAARGCNIEYMAASTYNKPCEYLQVKQINENEFMFYDLSKGMAKRIKRKKIKNDQ